MLTIKEKREKFGKENIDVSGNVIYPITIKSKQAYEDWLMSKRHYEELKKHGDYQTSDNDLKVNLRSSKRTGIKREIIDLPQEEQDKIMERWEEVSRAKGKTLGLFIRAFKKRKAVDNLTTNTQRLNEIKPEVIHLFSKLYSVNEVWRILNHQLEIKTTREALSRWRTANAEEIRIAQEKYKESFDEIRLVHKRSRLEELLDLYNDRREIYFSTKNQNDYRLLLNTLEQVRKEVEGDKVTVDATLQVKIESALTVQQEEMMRGLPIKTMIISLVAGRLGINPLQLLTRLTNSYYSEYTGMSGQRALFNASNITYPSSFIYNLEELQEVSKIKTDENLKLTEYEEIEEEKVLELSEVKQTLLEKLKERKATLNKRKGVQKAIDEALTQADSIERDKTRKAIISKPTKKPSKSKK